MTVRRSSSFRMSRSLGKSPLAERDLMQGDGVLCERQKKWVKNCFALVWTERKDLRA